MRRLLQSACIFLLLFAQQAALTHVLWHAQRNVRVERLEHSTAETTRPASAPHLTTLCALHALLGQVLGGASVDACGHTDSYVTGETPRHRTHEVAHQDFLAPLSRGPPSHLVS